MKKKILSCIVILIAFFTLQTTVFATSDDLSDSVVIRQVVKENDGFSVVEINSTKKKTVAEQYLQDLFAKVGSSLPSSYKTEGLTVKNQGNTTECWAFAFTSAIEAYNKVHNISTETYSPRHIDYSCSKTFKDGTNENSYEREVDTNGNYLMAMGYVASGQGPVLEDDMPFSEDTSLINLSELDKDVAKHITGVIQFPSLYKKYTNGVISYYTDSYYTNQVDETYVTSFRNKVKNQIKTNGGVVATVYDTGVTNICIQNTENKVNHGLLLVGWDDSYDANGTWSTPGAYIGLNSYGTGRYDNGYSYISYYDCWVESSLFGITSVENTDFSSVYEHDELTPIGETFKDSTESDRDEFAAVNVYDRDSSISESLTEIGVYTYSYEKVEIYYTEDFSGTKGLPRNYIKIVDLTDTLELGYNSIKLSTPVTLTGSKFAICVRYIADNEENVATIPVEIALDDSWWSSATAEVGETYFLHDSLKVTGDNTYTTHYFSSIPINAGIKAFTVVAAQQEEETVPTITSSVYTIKDKIITRVNPETDMSVFKSNITVNGSYVIIDANGNEVTSGIIKTGYSVKLSDNSLYPISVIGDLTGNGILDIADVSRMLGFYVGKVNLSGAYLMSADVTGNGTWDIADVSRIKKLYTQQP